MSVNRIKGKDGVVIESQTFLELPKAPTKITTYPQRPGMIRYNSEWKSFEGALEFDGGGISYRRFANLDDNGLLLSSQLPDSVTSGMKWIGTYSPISDDIDPPVTIGVYDKLPAPVAANSGQYFIVRGIFDAAQLHYNTAKPTTSPVIFTPPNPSGSINWIQIKYYFSPDPNNSSTNIVIGAFGRIDITTLPTTGHEGLASLSTDSNLTAAFTNNNNMNSELALTDGDWVISDGLKQQRLRQNRVSISAGAVIFDRTFITSSNRSFSSTPSTVQTVIDALVNTGLRRTGDAMWDDGGLGKGRLGLVFGTAAAPSIAFNDAPYDPITNPGTDSSKWTDNDTGMFRPQDGSIGFSSNGVERFRVEPQITKFIQFNSTNPATAPTVQFLGTGNTNPLGITALNNTFSFSTNNKVQVELTNNQSNFHGSVSIDNNLLVTGNATINGNTIIGDAGTDTATINAGSTFNGTTLFNNASNRFVLGAVVSAGGTLSFEGTSTASIVKNATELRFNMGAFHDLSVYDGSTLRTKINRYGIQLPVLNPIDNSVGSDGMIAYSSQRNSVMQKSNGAWSSVGSGGGVPTSFAKADWVLNGANYTYTVTAPNIQYISIQQFDGTVYTQVDVDSVVISATNGVLSIPATPDLRFDGRVLVQFT